MIKVGAFDARTHLSSLLDKVSRGAEALITRRGRPHVPGLWRLEIGNVLASAERRHQMRHDLRINGQIDACHAFGVTIADPASLRSDTFMHCARRPDAARIA